MKTILSTLMAVGILAGAASAQSPIYDPFNDPSLALPRSDVSNDDYRQALPRSVSNDDHRAALPFTDEVFPDTTIAKP
jgi:hypothetical protein